MYSKIYKSWLGKEEHEQMPYHIYLACLARMCRVRTPFDLPVHSHSGQLRVEERRGRELETGAAASSVAAAGNDVFLKWIFIFLTTNKKNEV